MVPRNIRVGLVFPSRFVSDTDIYVIVYTDISKTGLFATAKSKTSFGYTDRDKIRREAIEICSEWALGEEKPKEQRPASSHYKDFINDLAKQNGVPFNRVDYDMAFLAGAILMQGVGSLEKVVASIKGQF
jgi:hypothetical protein